MTQEESQPLREEEEGGRQDARGRVRVEVLAVLLVHEERAHRGKRPLAGEHEIGRAHV